MQTPMARGRSTKSSGVNLIIWIVLERRAGPDLREDAAGRREAQEEGGLVTPSPKETRCSAEGAWNFVSGRWLQDYLEKTHGARPVH